MGKNASGQTHYLSLSGFELYGTVNGVCEDQLGKKNNAYILFFSLKILMNIKYTNKRKKNRLTYALELA